LILFIDLIENFGEIEVRVVEMVGELVEGYGEAEETLMAKIANKNNQILSLRAHNDRLLNALSIQQQVTENSSNHLLNLQIIPPQTLEGESDSNSEEDDLSETWTTIKTMSPNDIYSSQVNRSFGDSQTL